MKPFLIVFLITVASATATEIVDPPLTSDTAVGVWEALWCQQPPTLWRMEMNKAGESYLAQITVGTKPIVRRLLSAEIAGGKVKLHFSALQSDGVDFPEIWIIGTGEGIATRGAIDAGEWHFVKGPWTRDVAAASKIAEESIGAKSAK